MSGTNYTVHLQDTNPGGDVMPTTFNVIYLGNHTEIDPIEGNSNSENASALVGQTFGSATDPLFAEVQSFSPGTTGFASGTTGVSATAYDTNSSAGDTFSIDGGPDQDFDAIAVYNATLTYTDGTTTTITAVIFQDTAGNTYLAPETSDNSDQDKLEADFIESLTLDSINRANRLLMSSNRETFSPMTCFVETTCLLTPDGPKMIQDLRAGDLLVTASGAHKPIRWIGRSTRVAVGKLAPVRIAAGALGPSVPCCDLLVSRQHRLKVSSRIVERMVGQPDALVAAKDLLGLPGVTTDTSKLIVTYMHVLLDEHELIDAHGAIAETLLAGTEGRKILGPDAAAEIEAVFPGLLDRASVPVCALLHGARARKLVARHVANDKALTH